MRSCTTPLELDRLLEYSFGRLSEQGSEEVEEHYFSCDDCTRALDFLRLLRKGVPLVTAEGAVFSSMTADLLRDVAARGVTVRTYRLEPGAEVPCTASPEDAFVVVRLVVPGLLPTERVDLIASGRNVATGHAEENVLEDVTVDRASGEIVYAYPASFIRSLPRTHWSIRARLKGPAGERMAGPYLLDHTPWEELERA